MTLRHITQDEFDAVVSQPGKKVLVDFFATWCNPCKMLGPMLEEVADSLPANAEIVKIDIDENMDAAKRFRVMSIPTLILFENGEPVKRMVGVQPQDEIAKLF